MLSTTHSSNNRLTVLLKMASIGLILVYLINCFTPLRLHVDTIRYFFLKDCMEHNCSPGERGSDDYLPVGYTFLLVILSKFGILKSFVIVLTNCIYLFGSLYFIKKIFRFSTEQFLLVAFFVLLNWGSIKFVVHPLSEMQFMFFSLASVCAFQWYSQQRKWWQLGLAIGLCIMGILTRTAGIALFFGILFSLVWIYWKQLKHFLSTHKLLVAIGIASVAAVFFFAKELGLTYYTSFVTSSAKQDLGTFIATNVQHHLEEVAELTANIPANKVYQYIPSRPGQILFLGFGAAALLLYGYLVFIRKNNIPVIVKAYLAFYFILIFNWPFFDPRFFVPMVPLMIASLVAVPVKKNQFGKILTVVFCIAYIIGGVVATGYTTYTSLNKEVLARKHANGVYRNEYETHFYKAPLSDTAKRTDPGILRILNRYD
jgi:MFS family permease